MGVYPYTEYILGYKVDPEKLVQWFSKYGLEKYEINLTVSSDVSKNLKLDDGNIDYIKKIADNVTKIFDGIELYCDNKSEAYIKFSGLKEHFDKINGDVDNEIKLHNGKISLERDVVKAKIRLSFLKNKLENFGKDSNYSYNSNEVRIDKLYNEYLNKQKEDSKEEYEVVNPFAGDPGRNKSIFENRRSKLLECQKDIPKDVQERACQLYREIGNISTLQSEEVPEIDLFTLERCWTSW
jgi:hypothetical protein